MEKAKEIAVTVKLVFNVNVPQSVKTPDNMMAEYLVNKLAVDVQWAGIESRQVLSGKVPV